MLYLVYQRYSRHTLSVLVALTRSLLLTHTNCHLFKTHSHTGPVQTHSLSRTHTCTQKHEHTLTPTCTHTYFHAHTQMHTRTHTFTHTQTCRRTFSLSHIHTYTCIHTHTHVYTHTYTYTLSRDTVWSGVRGGPSEKSQVRAFDRLMTGYKPQSLFTNVIVFSSVPSWCQ